MNERTKEMVEWVIEETRNGNAAWIGYGDGTEYAIRLPNITMIIIEIPYDGINQSYSLTIHPNFSMQIMDCILSNGGNISKISDPTRDLLKELYKVARDSYIKHNSEHITILEEIINKG